MTRVGPRSMSFQAAAAASSTETAACPVSSSISEEGPGKARADFVLGDRDGSTCEPEFTALVANTLRAMGYNVKINDPYKGVELVRAFSDPKARRHSLQVEVNRRLYMDERTHERLAGFRRLASHLEVLADRIAEIPLEELRPYRAAAE